MPVDIVLYRQVQLKNRHIITIGHGHRFICPPLVQFPPHPPLSSRLSRQRVKMLVTPTVTFLSLTLNLGVLLLFHGSDPNLVTTKQHLQRSIQTIESAAAETWSGITVHYNDVLAPPPTSSTSSFSLVDRDEWVYRGCAVRILRSLGGPVSHSPCTPSSSSSVSPSPSPFPVSSSSLPSASASTSVSTATELRFYTPLPLTCSISNAPFVVDHVEYPRETLGFVKIDFPCFWSLALCILVSSVTHAWSKVARSSQFLPSSSPL